MIILKTTTSPFRERAPEWVLSIATFGWGLSLFLVPGLFESNSFYAILLNIMPQFNWAIAISLLGLCRIGVMSTERVNYPHAHFRALGAVGGSMVWGSLMTIAIAQAAFRAPSISLIGIPLALEFMALWWAAGDAKIVDSAKSKSNGRG
jgi:hypothetical protein